MANVKKGNLRKDNLGWIFVSPWLIGFLGFTMIPMLVSLYIAFTEWNGFGGIEGAVWVGFKNFSRLLDKNSMYGETFYVALWQTILYTLMALIINFLIGISTAWSVVKPNKFNALLRTIIYLPAMTISTAFAIMMDPILGIKKQSLINRLLIIFGGTPQSWISTPGQGVWVMIMLAFWGFGSAMTTYYTGMKNIDGNIYDAAKIDGASNMTLLIKICIPMMSGTIVYQVIMGLVFGLQTMDGAMGLSSISGGGNGAMGIGNSLATLVFYLYNISFVDGTFGMASALGWLIFLITGVFGVGLLIYIQKTGTYSLDD